MTATSNAIKELRNAHNLSRWELASILGVHYDTVCKWENAKRTPKDEHKRKIAKRFNVDIQQMFYSN